MSTLKFSDLLPATGADGKMLFSLSELTIVAVMLAWCAEEVVETDNRPKTDTKAIIGALAAFVMTIDPSTDLATLMSIMSSKDEAFQGAVLAEAKRQIGVDRELAKHADGVLAEAFVGHPRYIATEELPEPQAASPVKLLN